jgi:hypothetical protein
MRQQHWLMELKRASRLPPALQLHAHVRVHVSRAHLRVGHGTLEGGRAPGLVLGPETRAAGTWPNVHFVCVRVFVCVCVCVCDV